MAVMGQVVMEKFKWKWEGSQEWGRWKFIKSLQIVRKPLPSLRGGGGGMRFFKNGCNGVGGDGKF